MAPGAGGGGGGGGGLPRYDLTYQLNEVEARAEDYCEALAFVRLLNALLAASGDGLPDGGRPYAHFSAFVRVTVLGSLHQRAFRCVPSGIGARPKAQARGRASGQRRAAGRSGSGGSWRRRRWSTWAHA